MIPTEQVKGTVLEAFKQVFEITSLEELKETSNVDEWAIWQEAGLQLTDEITILSGDASIMAERKNLGHAGWWMYVDLDDFMCLLYKDDKPMAGIYVSTRGRLYQADAYVVPTEKQYFSSNIGDDVPYEWTKGDRNMNGIVKDRLFPQPTSWE